MAFEENNMCFLENGPWISVKSRAKKDTFKMAIQSFDTQKSVFFIHHKSYSLFLNFWKSYHCSIKIKENIADSKSGLKNFGLYFVHFLLFKICNISPTTNNRKLKFWIYVSL